MHSFAASSTAVRRPSKFALAHVPLARATVPASHLPQTSQGEAASADASDTDHLAALSTALYTLDGDKLATLIMEALAVASKTDQRQSWTYELDDERLVRREPHRCNKLVTKILLPQTNEWAFIGLIMFKVTGGWFPKVPGKYIQVNVPTHSQPEGCLFWVKEHGFAVMERVWCMEIVHNLARWTSPVSQETSFLEEFEERAGREQDDVPCWTFNKAVPAPPPTTPAPAVQPTPAEPMHGLYPGSIQLEEGASMPLPVEGGVTAAAIEVEAHPNMEPTDAWRLPADHFPSAPATDYLNIFNEMNDDDVLGNIANNDVVDKLSESDLCASFLKDDGPGWEQDNNISGSGAGNVQQDSAHAAGLHPRNADAHPSGRCA